MSACYECPFSGKCSQLQEALNMTRQSREGENQHEHLLTQYQVLMNLKKHQWFYPHNVQQCLFEDPLQSVQDSIEKLCDMQHMAFIRDLVNNQSAVVSMKQHLDVVVRKMQATHADFCLVLDHHRKVTGFVLMKDLLPRTLDKNFLKLSVSAVMTQDIHAVCIDRFEEDLMQRSFDSKGPFLVVREKKEFYDLDDVVGVLTLQMLGELVLKECVQEPQWIKFLLDSA